MSYENRLRGEISAVIERMMESGQELQAAWITHEVCKSHEEAVQSDHEDADYWLWCGYKTTREYVRRCLSKKIEPDVSDSPNLTLPGFQHLQTHYLVNRNGDDVGVPIEQMTQEELEEKVSMYRAMGAACYAHADELQRYQNWSAAPAVV